MCGALCCGVGASLDEHSSLPENASRNNEKRQQKITRYRIFRSALDRTRTCDLLIRSPILEAGCGGMRCKIPLSRGAWRDAACCGGIRLPSALPSALL